MKKNTKKGRRCASQK
ncbi:hypothetical protein SEETMRM10961_17920 [Salmonella enterica subsp. enterica serovar Typhimurium]|nr:hypothetical protein SEETMRM10961_17920 [Salmonella enterica subsp. enterica serovar Typhimurium]